jgi:septum formation protein
MGDNDTMNPSFYLASRSPRRMALLQQQGYCFVACPADIPEMPQPGETAPDYALRIALEKARAVEALHPQLPVLGADTDVVLDGQILGKPRNRDDAIRMLCALSGRSHTVVSAVAVVRGAIMRTAQVVTAVDFVDITAAQAAAYWATGEPSDKAGAYAIQGIGAAFVRAIRGSYTGVVGLPLAETITLLDDFGIQVSAQSVAA